MLFVIERGLNNDYLYYMRISDLGIINHFVREAYFQVHYWSYNEAQRQGDIFDRLCACYLNYMLIDCVNR